MYVTFYTPPLPSLTTGDVRLAMKPPNLVHLGIVGRIRHYVPKSVNLEAPHCIAFDHLPIVIRRIQFHPIYAIVLHHRVRAGR